MSGRRFRLLFAATLLLSVTLLEPLLPLPGRYYRFVFVLDITQSMNVEDVALDGNPRRRLVLAKEAVWRTIETMPCRSQAGFAVFTAHRSYLLVAPVEVCAHYRELRKILDNIDWQMAWRSRSEISKGLISAMKIGMALDPPARIVFLSDGHEAPPVNRALRQVPKRVASGFVGALIGVGGDIPSPIPRYSPAGRKLGYWRAEDIDQVDLYSAGRPGSGEAMVDADGRPLQVQAASGQEHLSSLHEDWLKQLAGDAGYRYTRLETPAQTARFLTGAAFADRKTGRTDARWLFGAAGLVLVVLVYSAGSGTRRREDNALDGG